MYNVTVMRSGARSANYTVTTRCAVELEVYTAYTVKCIMQLEEYTTVTVTALRSGGNTTDLASCIHPVL